MFLVVTNTREHFLRYFALLRLTEALPLTMAEPLPEISREQADLLLRQIHAALGTPRAGDRVGSGAPDVRLRLPAMTVMHSTPAPAAR